MSDIKQEKGITMLALILMIIIMLILVKASVSIITGADGMVDNTKSTIDLAKQESLNEQIREEIKQEEIKAKLLGQELSGETITNIINSHGGEYDYKVKINLDSQGATETGTTEIFENYNKNFVIYKDNQYNVMTYVTYRIEFPEKYDTDGSNMIFMGYYTEPEGQGVQYINEDGYLNQEAADTKHFIREGTLYAYWIRVPEEYQELAYIKSTGKQYIDTGVQPNQDTRWILDMNFTYESSACRRMGCRTYTSSSNSKNYYIGKAWSEDNYNFYFEYNEDDIHNYEEKSKLYNQQNIFDVNKNKLLVNEVEILSQSYNTFSVPYNLLIFAFNDDNGHVGTAKATEHSKVTLYSSKIYDNGTLVRNFIPCKSKGIVYDVDGTQCAADTIGLFDTVQGEFYTNKGTGNFIAGEEVNQ